MAVIGKKYWKPFNFNDRFLTAVKKVTGGLKDDAFAFCKRVYGILVN
jgi:hypothetical protein